MAIGQLKRIARCPNCYCIDPGMQQSCSKTAPKIYIIEKNLNQMPNSPKIHHFFWETETDRTLLKLLLHRSRHAARLFQNRSKNQHKLKPNSPKIQHFWENLIQACSKAAPKSILGKLYQNSTLLGIYPKFNMTENKLKPNSTFLGVRVSISGL